MGMKLQEYGIKCTYTINILNDSYQNVINVEYFQVDVVEVHLHMTDSMVSCQAALLDLIDACVKELKRGNPTVRS